MDVDSFKCVIVCGMCGEWFGDVDSITRHVVRHTYMKVVDKRDWPRPVATKTLNQSQLDHVSKPCCYLHSGGTILEPPSEVSRVQPSFGYRPSECSIVRQYSRRNPGICPQRIDSYGNITSYPSERNTDKNGHSSTYGVESHEGDSDTNFEFSHAKKKCSEEIVGDEPTFCAQSESSLISDGALLDKRQFLPRETMNGRCAHVEACNSRHEDENLGCHSGTIGKSNTSASKDTGFYSVHSDSHINSHAVDHKEDVARCRRRRRSEDLETTDNLELSRNGKKTVKEYCKYVHDASSNGTAGSQGRCVRSVPNVSAHEQGTQQMTDTQEIITQNTDRRGFPVLSEDANLQSSAQRISTKGINKDHGQKQSFGPCTNVCFKEQKPPLNTRLDKLKQQTSVSHQGKTSNDCTAYSYKPQGGGQTSSDNSQTDTSRQQDTHDWNKVEESYSCTVCCQKFPVLKQLEQHVASHIYTCEVCGKIFSKEENLGIHYGLHGQHVKESGEFETVSVKRTRESNDGDSKALICWVCGIPCSSMNDFRDHMKKLHNKGQFVSNSGISVDSFISVCRENNGKKYVCKVCSKSFVYSHSAKRHIDIHLGKKAACPVCKKSYSTKSSVKRHVARIHRNQAFSKPFGGNDWICRSRVISDQQKMPGKFSNIGDGLESSLQNCRDGKPYCEVCKRWFTSILHTLKHMEKHKTLKAWMISGKEERISPVKQMIQGKEERIVPGKQEMFPRKEELLIPGKQRFRGRKRRRS